jgi:hypothetical protein
VLILTTRVFLVRYAGAIGTAFAVDVGRLQFLVTAAHVFKDERDESEIEIFFEREFKKMPVRRIANAAPNADICILEPWHRCAPAIDISYTFKNVSYGLEAYFLGFPYFMYGEHPEAYGGHPVAFVKRAIVSAIITKGGTSTIYLDAHNNPGFSGGPVAYRDASGQLYIIGVVSAYRVERRPIMRAGEETELGMDENTGIAIGYGINHVVDSIERYYATKRPFFQTRDGQPIPN